MHLFAFGIAILGLLSALSGLVVYFINCQNGIGDLCYLLKFFWLNNRRNPCHHSCGLIYFYEQHVFVLFCDEEHTDWKHKSQNWLFYSTV